MRSQGREVERAEVDGLCLRWLRHRLITFVDARAEHVFGLSLLPLLLLMQVLLLALLLILKESAKIEAL